MSAGGFWSMGGYARFVWPCFALVFGVLGWNFWAASRYQAEALKRARRSLAMTGVSE